MGIENFDNDTQIKLSQLINEQALLPDVDQIRESFEQEAKNIVLNEAYVGKTDNLLQCEKLFDSIKKKYNLMHEDLTDENCPEIKQIQKLLSKQFDGDFELYLVTPKYKVSIILSLLDMSSESAMYSGSTDIDSGPTQGSNRLSSYVTYAGQTRFSKENGYRFDNNKYPYRREHAISIAISTSIFAAKDITGANMVAIVLNQLGPYFYRGMSNS